MMNKFVFTCGDINGIGPEIIIKTLNLVYPNSKNKFYIICPHKIFRETIKSIKPAFKYEFSDKFNESEPEIVTVITTKDLQGKAGNPAYTARSDSSERRRAGKPTAASGQIAFNAVKSAVELAKNKKVDAIITAPVSKTALNIAGIKFPGHTEMLAEWTNTKNFVMMFLSNKMKAALLSIHEPIKNVPGLISIKKIHNTLDVVISSLENEFKIKKPKIAVLGLNPHAGENGIIGTEEEKIIKPAIMRYNRRKLLAGPFSPDAFFASRMYKKYDVVIGMYHDQALIPFKLLNFGGGVNYTAGLPIVRTSPDHGVAYDIAGKNIADPSSMVQAYKYAEKIVKNRKSNVSR